VAKKTVHKIYDLYRFLVKFGQSFNSHDAEIYVFYFDIHLPQIGFTPEAMELKVKRLGCRRRKSN
jgi:hypothetical protein